MDNQPLVSVIVPCYNQAQYLEDCLKSVLKQTYKNWECIVVNDGSPDDTTEVSNQLCKLDSRFRYIEKENGGLASARNTGIHNAGGNYILPLDADDRIGKQYLECAINVFQDDESVSLIYCNAEKFDAVEEFWKLADYTYANLLMFNMIFCSAIYRKSDWMRVGGYDETLRRGWEDWEFWIRLLDEESRVVKLDDVHFYYRVKEQSMIKSMSNVDFEEIGWYIFQKHISKYKKHFPSPIQLALENTALKAENHLLKRSLEKVFSSSSYKVGNKLVRKFAFLKELQTKK